MHDASVDFCNTAQGEHVFLTIVGGHHCMTYEAKAIEIPLDECNELHGGSHGLGTVTPIDPMHFEYGSCEPDEYVDFSLTLLASDYHYNYLIEVEDLSEGRGTNPTALKLFLYDDLGGFNRREAEHRAEKAVDGVYSVEINVHNFHAGTSYFAVQCTDCLLYTSPSPRDVEESRMPSSA